MDPVYKWIIRSALKDIYCQKVKAIRIATIGSEDPYLMTKCQKVRVIKYHGQCVTVKVCVDKNRSKL